MADKEPAISNASLVDLCQQLKSNLKDRLVYRVSANGKDAYVCAKSPGQAALAVCKVERLKDKQLATAAFEALGNKP